MKVGDKAIDSAGFWTIIKIWDDGDITLMSADGYKIDVTSECFEHEFKLERWEQKDTSKWYNCAHCDAGYPDQECTCRENEE
tara:strand:+ start:87 stop:332 length:246 start_codon:yes stop_codon:yes gene_type:complete